MGKKTAFILSLIGGIGNILVSLFFGIIVFILLLGIGIMKETLSKNQQIFGNGIFTLFFMSVFFVLFLGTGIFGIYFSIKEKKEDKQEISKGGVGCLICGAVTLNVFLIIGGILGILEGKKLEENFSSDTLQSAAV